MAASIHWERRGRVRTASTALLHARIVPMGRKWRLSLQEAFLRGGSESHGYITCDSLREAKEQGAALLQKQLVFEQRRALRP